MSIDRARTVRKVLKAVDSVEPKVAKKDAGLFKSFCAGVAEQLRASYLERYGPDGVPGRLRGTFDWIKKRKQGEILVQIVPNGESRCLVQTCMADQAFIVDTVRLLVQAYGARVEAGFNAVLRVERSSTGVAKVIGESDLALESVVQLEVEGLEPGDYEVFAQRLRDNLCLSRGMVEDFDEMLKVLDGLASFFERRSRREPESGERYRETAAFINWLLSDNFVFMGLVSAE